MMGTRIRRVPASCCTAVCVHQFRFHCHRCRVKRIVLIRDDYSRVLFTVPNRDSVKVKTRGMRDSIWIYPGKTKVAEGNVVTDFLGNHCGQQECL